MTPIRFSLAATIITTLALAGPGEPGDSAEAAFAARFGGMFQPMAGFDWDAEAERIRVAAERLWERNQWTDESDVFAREVAVEVTRVPPWDVAGRLKLLTQRIAERYGLDESRTAQLRRSILREAAGFFLKNSPVLLEHGNDALRARAEGRPYTPEQVQRWAKVLDPLMADAQASADRLAQEIKAGLPPEKKAVFERDMRSFDRRIGYVEKMKGRWAQGEWAPEDWGMEADPIQTGRLRPMPGDVASGNDVMPRGAVPLTLPGGAPVPVTRTEVTVTPELPSGSRAALPSTWLPTEPQTWIAYVAHVEKKFAFDVGQKTTAASIHTELVTRASDYLSAHRTRLDAVPRPQRAEHPDFEPVRSLFEEMKVRLDALPTTVQRQAAQ